jgi:hypothetical protein
MKTMTRMMTPAALVALALLSAAPALAQPAREPASASSRVGSQSGSTSAYNSRLMAEVLREFGYSPDRLGRRQQERLDEVRYRLFPDAPRQRLNRSQAVAVVYVALVYPRGTGGGRGGWDGGNGWGGGDGWDDDRDRDRPSYGGRCAEIDTGVYALLNMVRGGGDGFGFIDEEDKVRIQARATQVQSAAIARNYRQVADRAADVIGSLSAWMPERRLVAQRIDALKAAADQACGDRGQR